MKWLLLIIAAVAIAVPSGWLLQYFGVSNSVRSFVVTVIGALIGVFGPRLRWFERMGKKQL